MSDSNKRKPAPEKPQASATLAASRRRLLRGGVAAGPVLMTLVSRPVLAQVAGHCTTPSGFVSLNASNAGRGVDCEGFTYQYWKSAPQSAYPPAFPPEKPFNAVFNNPVCGTYGGPPPLSLRQVLSLGSDPPNDVARVIVAALLNAASGFTPVLGVETVKHMWEEYCTSGYSHFSPQSGASWNTQELLDYLSTTQTRSGVG
jgi:hypothetical protein